MSRRVEAICPSLINDGPRSCSSSRTRMAQLAAAGRSAPVSLGANADSPIRMASSPNPCLNSTATISRSRPRSRTAESSEVIPPSRGAIWAVMGASSADNLPQKAAKIQMDRLKGALPAPLHRAKPDGAPPARVSRAGYQRFCEHDGVGGKVGRGFRGFFRTAFGAFLGGLNVQNRRKRVSCAFCNRKIGPKPGAEPFCDRKIGRQTPKKANLLPRIHLCLALGMILHSQNRSQVRFGTILCIQNAAPVHSRPFFAEKMQNRAAPVPIRWEHKGRPGISGPIFGPQKGAG